MLRARVAAVVGAALILAAAVLLLWRFSPNAEAPKPVAQTDIEPQPLPRPSNELKEGEECTEVMAGKLDPEHSASSKKEFEDAEAANPKKIEGVKASLKSAFELGRSLPKTPFKLKKKVQLAKPVFWLSVPENYLETYEFEMERESDGLAYTTCITNHTEYMTHENMGQFSGNPRELAGLVLYKIEDFGFEDTNEQYTYYSNYDAEEGFGFIPLVTFEPNGSIHDPITEKLKELVVSPFFLLHAGPWVRKVIKLLPEGQKRVLSGRFEELWKATVFDFDEFAKQVNADKDFTQSDGNEMHGLMYRRALASRIGEDLMRIYRAWLITFAHDAGAEAQVAKWAHVVREDLKKLERDKHKYRLLISRLNLPKKVEEE